MKTEVEIIGINQDCQFKIGDKGYIDGYCRGGNGQPMVVVIVGDLIDLVPFYALKVINQEKDKFRNEVE